MTLVTIFALLQRLTTPTGTLIVSVVMPDVNLKAAALTMLSRSWLCMPLKKDDAGMPKRPIVMEWTSLQRSEETVRSLPWDGAAGLGIVLGHASNDLGVIDIDDEELWVAVSALWPAASAPRMVETFRKRGHLYVAEKRGASASTRFSYNWDGREVNIELKATGTQVAAPPTPGYTLWTQGKPLRCGSLPQAWDHLKRLLAHHYPDFAEKAPETPTNVGVQGGGPAGYPKPWLEHVPKGERNKAVYIEAHKLREAGLHQEAAVEMLWGRVKAQYEAGEMGYTEYLNTVRSAYRKGAESHGLEDDDDPWAEVFRGGGGV